MQNWTFGSPGLRHLALSGWRLVRGIGLMAAGRVARGEAIGNTQTMTGVPARTLYHRWLGWHALAMRRAVTVLIAGLIVALALLPFATWGMALIVGWDAAALTFLLTTWPLTGGATRRP
jgi:hypothetical protein